MSIGLSEFWTRLVRAGITDAVGCRDLADAFARSKGSPPDNPARLAEFMIEADSLTPFQAKSLLSQQAGEIRVGSFLIRSDQSPPPLSRWVEVEKLADLDRTTKLRGFLLRTVEGNSWLESHAKLRSANLQSFELEPLGQYVAVFTPWRKGRLLYQILRSESIEPQRSCQIGIVLSAALNAMHQSGLVHGGVRSDRVWITEDNEVVLLRDPSDAPTHGLGDTSSAWLDSVDTPESYVAPELADSSRTCDAASDLYSLGCLVYRMVHGEHAFARDSVAKTLQSHANDTPPPLAAALAKGESGDPMNRVLAYAMAKNPAARFASADQLSAALQAILPTLVSEVRAKQSKPIEPRAPSAASKSSEKAPKKSAPKKIKSVAAVDRASKPTPPSRTSDKPSTTAERESKPLTATPPDTVSKPAAESRKAKPTQPDKKPKPAKESKSAKESQPIEPPPRMQPSEADSAAVLSPPIESVETVAPVKSDATEDDSAHTEPVAVETVSQAAGPHPQRRRKKKKTNKAPFVLAGLGLIVLLQTIVLMVRGPATSVIVKRAPRPPLPSEVPRVSNRSPDATIETQTPPPLRKPDESTGGYEIVSDERLLFAPPYSGGTPNVSLELLPPGPAMIISVDLQTIRSSNLGSQVVKTLSPELEGLIHSAVVRTGVSEDSIRRLTVGFFPAISGSTNTGLPELSLVVELAEPQGIDTLVDTWDVGASRTSDGETIYAGDEVGGDAFYLLADEIKSKSVSRFAVGTIDRISEVASVEGGEIPLPRSLRALWNGTSKEADFVALITPNFLFADGRRMLSEALPELIGPLKSFLIPDVSGALVTADISGDLVFTEIRLAPSGGISEAALMRATKEAVDRWPVWASEFVVQTVPDASWRLLASRLPSMTAFVAERFRYGVSDQIVVANTYLPGRAVTQLSLATLLTMNTPVGSGKVVSNGASTDAKPLTIAEMLDRKMSVSFDQESLEFAIDAIVEEFERNLPAGSVMPKVQIIGGDLQKMGITQNQQIRDFSKTELPLRKVLTDLVLGANPDKSATGPKDPKQSLIWVVADAPGQPKILVTTRVAAGEKNYEVPTEFQIEASK